MTTTRDLRIRALSSWIDVLACVIKCSALLALISNASNQLSTAQAIASSRSLEGRFMHGMGDDFGQLVLWVAICLLSLMAVADLSLLIFAIVFLSNGYWSRYLRGALICFELLGVLLAVAWVMFCVPAGFVYVCGIAYVVIGVLHMIASVSLPQLLKPT